MSTRDDASVVRSTGVQIESPAARRVVHDARRVERVAYLVGAGLIAAGVLHLGVAAVDPRPWFGPLSWRKAVTFGVSFGITLVAITWVSSYLRLSSRARTWLLGVFAADCVVEVAGVTLQAWRHVPSHLNTETPFDSIVAYSLAGGGAVLVVVLGALAITALRGRIEARPSMRVALRAGFALLLAGLGSGVAMIVHGVRLKNGGHLAAAYDDAGYLKWFHGVTLHAVLVLPLLAWWVSRTTLSEARRTRVVTTASAAYVVTAIATLIVSLGAA
jgi:hypothetical protein